jgi:hypothetical protein
MFDVFMCMLGWMGEIILYRIPSLFHVHIYYKQLSESYLDDAHDAEVVVVGPQRQLPVQLR